LYIQPQNNAAFVAMDEKTYQLLDKALLPIPMKPGKPERKDGEYIRN